MRKSDLKPRKSPRQQRSQAMVELILEAATRVLARESLAGFNTNRVAEVAGISVGSLYQYFPNKSALVTALIDRAHADFASALQQVLHKVTGQPLRAVLHATARLAIEQQYASPVLAAALDHEEKRLPIRDRLEAFSATLLAMVTTLLERHAHEMAPDLPGAAAADCLTITKALVEADAELGRQPASDLEGRIVRALLGYLTLPGLASVRPVRRPRVS
jgi:AcrR family transcriptional regulator